MLRKFTMALAVLLSISMLLAGCSKEDKGTIRIGVRSDIVNFGYYNENTGKYYGIEIDIAEEMAERLGYGKIEYVPVEPDTRKEMLLNEEVDCLIALYSIADTRKENFDFSPAYYEDNIVLMVEKSSMFGKVEDMKDKNIGILGGSNAGPVLAQRLFDLGIITDKVVSNTDEETIYEGAKVTKATQYKELSVMLEEGKVDAVCFDQSISASFMNEDRMLIDTSIEPQEYGIATNKGSALSKEVAEVVQGMLDDGTIDKIIDKWD